jgi:hypothetical protein
MEDLPPFAPRFELEQLIQAELPGPITASSIEDSVCFIAA